MFPGFDVSVWDDHLVWLWRRSNLRFVGFYLAHSATGTRSSWTAHWHDLRDMGWGIAPFWLPFSSDGITAMRTADGTSHGRLAADRAREAGVEVGATIYLDVESPVLTATSSGFDDYINAWCREVAAQGFVAGVYCSRLDAVHLLGARYARTTPRLFPFSVPLRTIADWNERLFRLKPLLADGWDRMSPDPAWKNDPRAVGCQYDWFNNARDHTGFHWPDANGSPAGFRSVDWDMSKGFDPSHPGATAALASAAEPGTSGVVHLFRVNVTGITYRTLAADGSLAPEVDLALPAAATGPAADAEVDGYDPWAAAAVSRRAGHCDLFVQGQDGFVRTAWVNPQERFPRHPWAIGGQRRCRRGTPIVGVSREVDQIDIFAVSDDHRLITQWWSPLATDWPSNYRTLDGPLVAGGSNLAALSRTSAPDVPGGLDVFYVGLDYMLPLADPGWTRSCQVIRAEWSQAHDWQVGPVAGLDSVAAASGIAAARDAAGTLHVVAQSRDRTGTRHARLDAAGTWQVAAGPGPMTSTATRREWWTSLDLLVRPDFVLLVGMTSARRLAWSVWRAGAWSAIADQPTLLSAARRPVFRYLPTPERVEIWSVDDSGVFASLTMLLGPDGALTPATP